MAPIAFTSQSLPGALSPPLVQRLTDAHRAVPFSAADPRDAARRTATIAQEMGLEVTVYRGALDLQSSEVDHVWVDLGGCVLDVAFPLFLPTFVEALRRFVAGDAEGNELEAVAAAAGLEQRVLGEFPKPLRYLGEPVWSARR